LEGSDDTGNSGSGFVVVKMASRLNLPGNREGGENSPERRNPVSGSLKSA